MTDLSALKYLPNGLMTTPATLSLFAAMSNMSAKTGQAVSLDDLLTNVSSRFYNWQFTPTAADFEKDGDLDMPEYGDDEYMVPGNASLPLPRNPNDNDEWMPLLPRTTAKA